MQLLNDRYGVGERLSRTRLRLDEAVAAIQDGWNGLLLNLRHLLELEPLLEAVGQVSAQIELGEPVGRKDLLFDGIFRRDASKE